MGKIDLSINKEGLAHNIKKAKENGIVIPTIAMTKKIISIKKDNRHGSTMKKMPIVGYNHLSRYDISNQR